MRFRIGKLLRWLLDGFDPVGYLMRGNLSEVFRGTREKEELVGRLTREERAFKREELKHCRERVNQLEEQLLQDEVENPNQAGDFVPGRKERRFRFLVVETRVVQADDSFDALQQVRDGEGRPIIVQTEQFPIGKSSPEITIAW